MTITKRLGITLTPLRLHAASTVRIPHSTNNFQNLLPTVRVTPLNLFSASTFNLHGASNSNMHPGLPVTANSEVRGTRR